MTRTFSTGLLGLVTLAALVAAARPPAPPAQAPSANDSDPFSLFTKLVPVFMHPRCVNCHGATDPSQDLNHGGGRIGADQSCTSSCHSAPGAEAWRLGPQWSRSTSRDLCSLMAAEIVERGRDGFLAHLRDDKLIGQAYIGLMGGARDTNAVPPSMKHAQFLAAAQTWADDGFGACDREGAIIHTEKINSDNTYIQSSDYTLRVMQSGSREVTVRFVNGGYEAHIQVAGSITLTQTMRAVVNGVPCETVINTHVEYQDVDDPGPNDPVNNGITVRTSVQVKLQSDGRYTVTVHLPEEKHSQRQSATLQNGCGSVLRPASPETLEQVWPTTSFVFRGTLPNPTDRTRLIGKEERVWKERGASAAEDPWLPDHYAAADQDGSFHPVTITTRWNIRYRP